MILLCIVGIVVMVVLSASILFSCDRRMRHLFVQSFSRVRRVALMSFFVSL